MACSRGPYSFAARRKRSSCSLVMYEIRVRTCLARCFGILTTFLRIDGVMGAPPARNSNGVMMHCQEGTLSEKGRGDRQSPAALGGKSVLFSGGLNKPSEIK